MSEDGLSAETINKGLETRLIGRNLLYYPSVTSTNDVARQQARQAAPEGTVIIADEQTAGKGRLKRAWLTPGGNIALSVILYPKTVMLPSLIMLASLAVVHSIGSAVGLTAGIKWPNDILIGGKKVCGILIENDLQGNRVNHSIIGIGINTNLDTAGISEIQYPATSLSAELGKNVSRSEIIRRLLVELDRMYLAVSEGGSVFEEWRDSLLTLGQQVRIRSGDTVFEGIAESVAGDGSLLIRAPDGSLSPVVAGDVTLRA